MIKDIGKIDHVTSWHQWLSRSFTKLQEYFLCAKKTVITYFIQQSALFMLSMHALYCESKQR